MSGICGVTRARTARPDDPFALPSEPGREHVQVAFSGGRSSAYMLHRILEANGGLPERAVVTFQNTGREMDETLDFVHECSVRWGVDVKWLEYDRSQPKLFRVTGHNDASRDGEPFEALIRLRQFLPNPVARFCTIELKVRTSKRYLRTLGWKHWWNAVGFRRDESHRVGKPQRDRWKVWTPLYDAGITKADVADFWRRQPFDLRLEGVNGRTPLGNCDGCFLKSEATQYALARDHPERHAWWERMEAMALSGDRARNLGHRFRSEYSKASLSRMAREQGDFFSDNPGLLCQASGGECTG